MFAKETGARRSRGIEIPFVEGAIAERRMKVECPFANIVTPPVTRGHEYISPKITLLLLSFTTNFFETLN